jgi:hypothetical protein
VDLYRALEPLELLADVAVSNVMREVPTRMHPKDVLRDVHDRVPTATSPSSDSARCSEW